MSQEKMSQDEIDGLLKELTSGEFVEDSSFEILKSKYDEDASKKKHNAVISGIARYEYALQNGTEEEIRDARTNLHHAAFYNWLFKYNLTKSEYHQLMNREAKKRGMKSPFILT